MARIAYDVLQEEDPAIVKKVNKLLKYLEDSHPDLTKKEGIHPFVECTNFADDYKYQGGDYQKEWHFIDIPFLDQGGDISDYDFIPPPHNATEALSGLIDWFNKAKHYKKGYIYQ